MTPSETYQGEGTGEQNIVVFIADASNQSGWPCPWRPAARRRRRRRRRVANSVSIGSSMLISDRSPIHGLSAHTVLSTVKNVITISEQIKMWTPMPI